MIILIMIIIWVGAKYYTRTEVVLFEISNSMKPYPSAFHACTSKLRPVIVCFSSRRISMRFPTVFRQLLKEERLSAELENATEHPG